jgi:hypothetical protein
MNGIIGKTIWVLGETYTIAEWVYTQKEDYPIHRVEYRPDLAAEIHPNGDIDIRVLDAFDKMFESSFSEPE